MGIAKNSLKLLLELKKNENFSGKILQLGRQHTFLTYEQIKAIAKDFKVPLNEGVSPSYLSFNPAFKKQRFVDDITLFKMLGFEDVQSMDYSDYEKATYIHDLNLPVPDNLYDQFDVIFDGGTIEHIFHLPNVLSNIHKMLKKSGIVIHASPSTNHLDHGFYMFSPALFHDYYSTNKYEMIESKLFEFRPLKYNVTSTIYEYTPGCLDKFSLVSGFSKYPLGIWAVAKKKALSSCGKIPQQGYYVRTWNPTSVNALTSPKKENKVKRILKKIAILRTMQHFIKKLINRCFKRGLKKPKIIGYY